MESVHDISEGFLTYDYRKDTNAHLCLLDVIELYSDYLVVHLDALKERICYFNIICKSPCALMRAN